MAERKPRAITFESWVDRQVREARERGAFRDLPGHGKPIEGLGQPHKEGQWLRSYVERTGGPPPLTADEKLRRKVLFDRMRERRR